LDNGYSVVIDLNATWCGPCWSYHTSDALEDLWENHGPAGQTGVSAGTTDDVYVFMIESDNNTTSADLNGTTSGTMGNWVTGTQFPIIDDGSIAGPYGLAFYPTVYTICPNRQMTRVGGQTGASPAATLYSHIGTCPTLDAGTDYSILSHNGDEAVCGAGSVDVEVTMQNAGATTMTSCTIEVRDGSTVLSTTPWTGNLASWDVETVALGSVSISGSTSLDIVITDADADAANSTISKMINLAELTSLDLEINVFTDNYPGETSWKIVNGSGTTVATGGPYTEGTDDQFGGGGPDALTTMTHLLTLPSATDCYSFVIEDSYGDGLQYGTNPSGVFGYTVTDINGSLLTDMTTSGDWDFGDDDTREAAFRTDGSSTTNSIAENAINGFGVYPNPFTTIATVNFNNNTGIDAIIEVVNMVGQVVYTENVGDASGLQNITIDGTSFDAGIYMINVKAGAVLTSERVVLTK
jgi:hypothetical protein